MLDWALYYARMGVAVHPLYPREKRPIGTDWTNKPVLTEDQLASAFSGEENLGIRTGHWSQPATGYALVVIDVDIRKTEEAATANATLQRFMGVDLSQYPATKSGSGGDSRHIWALVPRDHIPKSQRIACSGIKFQDGDRHRFTWEIDLLSTGKNLVVPPSIHPDTGLRYEWEGKLPHEGIPLFPETALEKLKVETEQDRVADADQPDILPAEGLPTPGELLLSSHQKAMLVSGESYGLTGDRSRDIMGLASILLHQGYDRQEVLSILYHNAPGQIATEGFHASKDPAKWLWRYGLGKVLDNEKPEAYKRYKARNGIVELDGFGFPIDGWDSVAPQKTENEPEASTGSTPSPEPPAEPEPDSGRDDLLEQARLCNPGDPDRAVLIYYKARSGYGATFASIVGDELKELGFSIADLKEDAKKRGKELSRKIRMDQQGVAAVVQPYPHGEAWRNPRHPVHGGISNSEWDKIVGQFLFVPSRNKWFDLKKRIEIGPEGLNMMLAHSIRRLLVEDGFDPDELPRNPKAAEYLVNRDNIVMVDGETFFPGARGPVVEWEGKAFVNTWRAPDIEPEFVRDEEIAPWLNHVEYLFPQERYREVLFDWMAWVVQNQGEKINWQLVIGSTVHGNGKDTLWNQPLRHACGDEYVNDGALFTELEGQYDDWLLHKKVVIVQESHQSNKRDWVALENRLKSICTAPPESLLLNPKFGSKVRHPNLWAIIFSTNYRDGFMPEDHRRYHFLWSDAPKPDASYFNALYTWYARGGAKRVAQWLLTREISEGFSPKVPPEPTEWGQAVKYAGVSPTQRRVREAIDHFISIGRKYTSPEQVKEHLKAEDQMTGDGFIPGVEKITSIMQGFGMRPLTDRQNRPEINVPKAVVLPGYLAVDITNTRRTCVFPLQPGYATGSVEDIWMGMCPDQLKSELDRAIAKQFEL